MSFKEFFESTKERIDSIINSKKDVQKENVANTENTPNTQSTKHTKKAWDYSKHLKIALIFFGVGLVFSGIGLASGGLDIEEKKIEDYNVQFEKTDNFTLDVREGDIQIYEDTSINGIGFSAKGVDKDKLYITENLLNTKIESEARYTWFSVINFGRYYLDFHGLHKRPHANFEIHLSPEAVKNLNIHSNFGDITIKASAINLDSLTINSNYGDLDASGFNLENLDINFNFGDIILKYFNVENDAKIKSDYGDTKLDSFYAKTINMHSNFGDTTFFGDVFSQATFISNYGDLSLSLKRPLSETYGFSIKQNMGDLKVKGQNTAFGLNTTGDVRINIKSDYGDIKIS
ncbi:hypothetical protein FACS1894132_00720 [Clostridia bacterium]|nr:hypothetical protein FACS1894132_00720 [Clostridia bacterium]